MDLNDPHLSFAPLSVKLEGDPRIATQGERVYVASSGGLLILDPYGEIKWDSKNYISTMSDGLPPRIYNNYFTFTSIGRMGGSDVRNHSIQNPANFEFMSYEKRLLCPPLLSLGKLIVAIGDERSVELKVK